MPISLLQKPHHWGYVQDTGETKEKKRTERANMPKTLLMLSNDEYHEKHTS